MLVAELIGQREFRLTEQPVDPPGPGEVQVRVGAVGICGSDVHSYAEGGDRRHAMRVSRWCSGTSPPARWCGRAKASPAGRRAIARRSNPRSTATTASFAAAGRHNICANIRFLSNPGIPGFFREFVNLPVINLLALPPEMSMEDGDHGGAARGRDALAEVCSDPAGRYGRCLRRGSDRTADDRVPEGGGRGPHLGSRAAGASARDGEADGRGRGARSE